MSEFANINFIPLEFISVAFTYTSKHIALETAVNTMSATDQLERTKDFRNFISKN